MTTEAVSPLVAAAGLVKRFEGRTVLADVDLTIERDQTVAVVGLNGSGKTTLLRIVLGLIRPDAGTVWRKPGLRIGYMPQRLSVDASMPLSVRGFLALGRPSSKAAVSEILEEVGVAHLAGNLMHGISGGEAQRVLLARALVREPDLLVLDEPVQGVDIAGRSALYEVIRRVRERRGCGVVMVSHDLHLVMASTDRVLCLNHHVCCSGRPEEVSRHPEYLALFGDAIARELAVYQHRHDHRHDTAGNIVPLEQTPPERRVS